MGYLRTMGAGLAGSTVRYKGANVNQIQYGNKLQGLPPVTGVCRANKPDNFTASCGGGPSSPRSF